MKKIVYVGIALAVLIGGYYVVDTIFTPSFDIPTVRASRGEFVISLLENGTVNAMRAVNLSAPRVRGLQITWLAPEGTTVEKGAPVIKFDASKQQADYADHESELKIKTAALDRARKEYVIQEKQLQLDLEKARRNYDEKKHDATRIAEEARLEKELSELNFEAKLDQLKGDVQKAEVEVKRASDKLDLAEKELSMTTINAPIPGLVVYLEIWKGGTRAKVQEGDSPWPGQGLVDLPDLSEMKVETTVSEVDANKVDSGQVVEIVLDAFPDITYNGVVSKKGTLARKKDYDSKINVFDVEITILNHDDNIKPGMSAACNIIIERISDVLTIPLEAVFEREGQTVAYTKKGKKRPVTVGRKNDRLIEIVEGLEAGDELCLVDPTLGEPGLPGDRATEPELNRGRSKKSPPGGKRGRGSRKGS